MKRMLIALGSLSCAGGAALLATLAGCGSSPSSEDVSSGHEAYTYDTKVAYNPSTFGILVNALLDPQGASISVTNDVATFTPSPPMVDAGLGVKTANVPTISTTTSMCDTATVSIASLSNASPFSMTLDDAGVELDTTVSGVANIHTSMVLCPNPVVTLTEAPVHATIATDPSGNLQVTNAYLTLSGYTSTSACQSDLCPGLAESMVVGAQGQVNSFVTSELEGILDGGQAGLYSALAAKQAAIYGYADAGLVPGSVTIGGDSFGDTLYYQAAPPTLSSCTATESCGGTGEGEWSIACPALSEVGGYTIVLQESGTSGWQTLESETLETPGLGASFTYTFPLTGTAQNVEFRVCSIDPAGTACGTPFIGDAYLTSCGPVIAPVTPGCPTGEVWNVSLQECVKTCNSPQCICIAQGGTYFDGKCQ